MAGKRKHNSSVQKVEKPISKVKPSMQKEVSEMLCCSHEFVFLFDIL